MDASEPLQITDKSSSAKEMTEQASYSGNYLEQEPSSSSAHEERAITYTKSDHAAWAVFNADISLNEFDVQIGRQVAVTDGNEQRLIENSSKFISDFVKKFQPISVLGKGGFGVVFECRSKVDQRNYAIKRIKLSNKPGSKEKAEREVRALERLKYKNIVGYITHWTETPPRGWQEETDKKLMLDNDISWSNLTTSSSDTENNDRDTFLYIQMELCQKESLQTWLEKNFSRDYKKCLGMIYQVLCAIEYLHANNFIHRDLKPANIMFSLDGVIKVGDFGLVTETDKEINDDILTNSETNKGAHTKGAGTRLYMAPEQMSVNYDKKVDIFALGLILFELFLPFSTQEERKCEMEKARNSEFYTFQRCSHLKAMLLNEMLSSKPSKRPTAEHGKLEIMKLYILDVMHSMHKKWREKVPEKWRLEMERQEEWLHEQLNHDVLVLMREGWQYEWQTYWLEKWVETGLERELELELERGLERGLEKWLKKWLEKWLKKWLEKWPEMWPKKWPLEKWQEEWQEEWQGGGRVEWWQGERREQWPFTSIFDQDIIRLDSAILILFAPIYWSSI